MSCFRLEGRHQGRETCSNLGGDGARATGVAEELVNVLNARRSPLTFRLQPLVLHLSTLDGHSSWAEGQGSCLFLVAKREVLLAFDEAASTGDDTRQVAGSDGDVGTPAESLAAASGAGAKGDGMGRRRVTMRVVEEEELGRIGPFSIYSATSVLASSSFTIPSSALLADIKRRREKGVRIGGAIPPVAAEGRNMSVATIVLEVVQDTDGGARSKATLLKKLEKRARGPTFDEGAGGTGRVIARAPLDPGFLRRTVGCQRSVVLMPPSRPTGANDSHDREESGEESSPLPFARLDVAGHAVSARPGRPKLRLQVLECQNLNSADLLGKSDPCVIALWNGVEVGRTPIARDDLNPVFPAAASTFCVPLAPPTITATVALDPTESPGEGGGRRSRPRRVADWQAYKPELRLEVWDMDRDMFSRKWKKGQLLGSVTLKGPGGIAPVIETSARKASGASAQDFVLNKAAAQGAHLRLYPDDRRRLSGRGSAAVQAAQASLGVVSVKIAAENTTDVSEAWLSQATLPENISNNTALSTMDSSLHATVPFSPPGSGSYETARPQGRLEIRCLDARRLPAGCDGYCRVFWNGRQVGSTLPASTFSRCGRDSAIKRSSPPASAFQRNPVWWASSSGTPLHDGQGGATSCPRSSIRPTAVVALNENPLEEDELTLEVFDGIHMRDAPQNTAVGVVSKLWRDSDADNDDAAARRTHDGTVGIGSACSSAARRDVLGRSLGNVTLRGGRLTNPAGGRIDLPLHVSPHLSTKGSDAAGVILSISLARFHSDESDEELSSCPPTSERESTRDPEHNRHHDSASAVANTPAAVASTESEGGNALEEEEEEETNHHRNPTRWLRLLLEDARLLKGLDVSGTSDPFCVVYVDRVWHSETRVCWGTLEPRWNHWIQVEVFGRKGAPAMGLGPVGHEIRVEVWDKDVVGADDFIGEAHLFLDKNHDG